MAAFKRWRARYKRYKLQIPPQMRNRIILHYGLFKITWDWVIMALVLYTAVEVPFVSAFIMTEAQKNIKHHTDLTGHTFQRMETLYPTAYPLLVTDICIDVIFMLDILLNFRTTYVKEGEVLITNPLKIAIHYFKSYFVVDFVAAIPWEFLLNPAAADENTTLFSLLKTARLLRLFRAARKLDRNYEYMTSLLFLMLMFFMIVAHWMACIWYFIGNSEMEGETSWLYKLSKESNMPFNESIGCSGPPVRSRYLTSLYYVMTLCTTVGFGNVSANTDAERVFTICGMLLGAVMYAGIFGNVTAIIHGQYSSNFRYRKESMAINEFVHFYKIRNPLSRRLREYSRHTWSQTKGTDMNKVLKKFPEGLQYEIHLHMHLTVLANSFLFLDAESSCLRSITMRMRRNHYLPGHFIVYEGDEVDTLHLIKRGKIDILINGEFRGNMVEGEAYGASLRQASSRLKAVTSLRAATCVDCHTIKIEELTDVLESYPRTRSRLLSLMDAADQSALYDEVTDIPASPTGTIKRTNNGEVLHMLSEDKRKKTCTFEQRNFLRNTFHLRPIFGCRKGDVTNEGGKLSTESDLANIQRLRSFSSTGDIASHCRFINITELSAIRSGVLMTGVTYDSPESQSDEDLGGYEEVEANEPVRSDINRQECGNEKHSCIMEDKYREMSRDIKRLEGKVDTLLSVLSKQQGVDNPYARPDQKPLCDSQSSGHSTTV